MLSLSLTLSLSFIHYICLSLSRHLPSSLLTLKWGIRVRVIPLVHPKYFCLESDGASLVFIYIVILALCVIFHPLPFCVHSSFMSASVLRFILAFSFFSDHFLFYDYFTHTNTHTLMYTFVKLISWMCVNVFWWENHR